MKRRLEKGEALFLDGKLAEAETVFTELLDQFPEHPDILNNLGIICESCGRLEDAKSYYGKALSVDNTHTVALSNLANAYQKEGMWQEAASLWERCESSEKNDPLILNNLATAYINLNAQTDARNALKRSLQLDPSQTQVKEILRQLEEEIANTGPVRQSSDFKASFAEINITPPVSPDQEVILQGMAGNPRKATAVGNALMMQMLLLEDANGTKVLFVTADLFGFDASMVDAVRKALEPWGIPPEGILLNASHTHYAPGTLSQASPCIGPFYGDYAQQIVQLILKKVRELVGSLEHAILHHGAAEVQIGVNRRLMKNGRAVFGINPDGFYFRHTPFLVIEYGFQKKRLVLVNHGCHPTGLGQEILISADYPGYMRNALATVGVADGVMFFQGAAGNTKQTTSDAFGPAFASGSKDAQCSGERLAAAIIDRLRKPLKSVYGTISAAINRVPMPIQPPIELAQIERILSDPTADPMLHHWAKRYLPEIQQGNDFQAIPLDVQIVSLGEQVSLIALQGEPVAELAKNLVSQSKHFESTFILGYTNGLVGYLPSEKMFAEGGYEVNSSHLVYHQPAPFQACAERVLTDAVANGLQQPDSDRQSFRYGRIDLKPQKGNAFFVMSAGRCGTMTMAHILNTAENARVWHHPQPDLITEALQAYRGKNDKRATFWKARKSLIDQTWCRGQIHGETDLLMTPFCDMLAEEIENAKFLLLTRHPADFVRSGMRRNYYRGHSWDPGRLRPEEGTVDFDAWKTMDQFDQICWLWRETYARALEIKESIGSDKVLTVRFEDILRDPSEIEKVFRFLDLEPFRMERTAKVLKRKLNVQRTGEFPKYEQWKPGLKRKLWDACSEVADRFGYRPSRKDKTESSGNRGLKSPFEGASKRIVFITGMHRSGTSFLSRSLNLCGLKLPDADSAGSSANEKGHWENQVLSLAGRRLLGAKDQWQAPVVVQDTEEVLADMHRLLVDYQSRYDVWGWKDPRSLIAFEYWHQVMPADTGFDIVVSIRNPMEVAASLQRRNDISIEEGVRLWERYNSHVLKFLQQGYPVHLFNFNADDQRREMNRLCERLGLEPNNHIWDHWLEDQLVYHEEDQVPASPIYRRIMDAWREQAGVDRDTESLGVSSIRPPLPLAILMVNGQHNYKDKLWLEKAIGNIIQHTSAERDYRVFVWNHDYKNDKVRKYLTNTVPYVETLDETIFDVHSFQSPKYDFSPDNILNFHGFHVHQTPLQILCEFARERYRVDTFITMDTDAWPVRTDWDLHLIGALDEGAKLAGVWRDEMASAIEPYVHASGLAIKADVLRENGLRFDTAPDGPHEDSLSHITRIIHDRYGKEAIHPLVRSNRRQYHPVFGGIYGDLIYHHHQGTLYMGGKQKTILFKGSSDRGEQAESNKQVCDALTEMVFFNHADYTHELLYGDAYEQLKIFYYLFRNSNSAERFQQMRQLAEIYMEEQPVTSFFIMHLIRRHFSFDASMYRSMATVYSRVGLKAESQRYEALAAQFDNQ